MKTRSRKVSDEYFQLVRRFPLRPIRNDSQHAEAVAALVSIDGKANPSEDEQDYANTLAMLVKEYERPRALPKRSVIDRLRHLMTETGMNVSGLGKIIGSQPEASMVLAGTRELSKEHIRRLAAHFNFDPGYFL